MDAYAHTVCRRMLTRMLTYTSPSYVCYLIRRVCNLIRRGRRSERPRQNVARRSRQSVEKRRETRFFSPYQRLQRHLGRRGGGDRKNRTKRRKLFEIERYKDRAPKPQNPISQKGEFRYYNLLRLQIFSIWRASPPLQSLSSHLHMLLVCFCPVELFVYF